MKPPPPRPLANPGDVLEGVLVWESEAVDQYGKKVLDIRIETPEGQVIPYRCNLRLWESMYRAVGDRERPRLRIARTADMPAIGNGRPIRAWTVELVESVPAPPQQPVRTTDAPAW